MGVISTPKFRKFHDLMPHRVREVLLVSSRYHAFILQEDGFLEEQVFHAYHQLSLSAAPRFTQVSTGAAALEAMKTRRFDLVLVVSRVPDMSLLAFGRAVKALRPGRPVVLLAFDDPNADQLERLVSPDALDAVFLWSGDVRILLAIIKYVEDRANVDNDIGVADVRVILLCEHSAHCWSTFLTALYPALMKQSQALFSDGLNRLQRLMRMRTRPKVLHAATRQQAEALYERYRESLLAVMCESGLQDDDGSFDAAAGMRFAARVRGETGDLPILLQADGPASRPEADRLCVRFVDRSSGTFLREVRDFLLTDLGFGDFVFRQPSGYEVARAGDVGELALRLASVPADSLEYHCRHDHISNWLQARSEFVLASRLKPRRVSEFVSIEAVRDYLLRELASLEREKRAGVIADATAREFDPAAVFQRFGTGSLGGKARGLAFLDQLLAHDHIAGEIEGMPIRVPQSFALTTDAFDQFVEKNGLRSLLRLPPDDALVTRRFLAGRLPRWVDRALQALVDNIDYPVAVRSSSLLEDHLLHPFAGIYGTAMLPNAAPDRTTRLQELRMAVKYVFATTFFRNARAYIANTARRIEEEKMGVVIQQLVGQSYGERFYPHIAGVAQSHNYYPIDPQRAEDGVAQMVLGLGRLVVEGGRVVRFSPRHPRSIPQFGSPLQMLRDSQSYFYALDLTHRLDRSRPDFCANPACFPLRAARDDGTIRIVGSIYDAQDDAIVESWDREGPWVVTFNNVLLHESIPLAPALAELVDLSARAMGSQIEIEFACDMGDSGRRVRRGQTRRPPVLYVLQLRPIVGQDAIGELERMTIPPERLVCRSTSALGHGRYENVRDIVYVKPGPFDPAQTRRIAREVGELNDRLVSERRPYVLIGPGRWGSSDPWLGIPVEWGQIAGARIIVEASPPGYDVEPSQGTHFFQNMTSLGVGYLTVPPGATRREPIDESFVSWDWLDALPAHGETDYLRHVQTPDPLVAFVDGRVGEATVAAPG